MKKVIFLLILAIFSYAFTNKEIKEIYYKSYNYEKMGNYKDAIRVLIPLYNRYKKGYTINLRLGWLFYLNKKYQNSIEHYKKALLVYPNSLEPKLGIMRDYLAMKDYKNALKIGEAILKIDYYNYYGNYYEILALNGVKDFENSLKLTKKMLAIYPTNVLFLTELGKIYYFLNKKDLSKKIFENVLILDPNNIVAKEYLK